jgi:hypothetical protein
MRTTVRKAGDGEGIDVLRRTLGGHSRVLLPGTCRSASCSPTHDSSLRGVPDQPETEAVAVVLWGVGVAQGAAGAVGVESPAADMPRRAWTSGGGERELWPREAPKGLRPPLVGELDESWGWRDP